MICNATKTDTEWLKLFRYPFLLFYMAAADSVTDRNYHKITVHLYLSQRKMLIIIILEVPVELAELLGENAPGLPEGLAIYLASDGREGDTYAVYSGNLKVEDGRAQFDLKLKDETVIHVDYEGEYRYSFE